MSAPTPNPPRIHEVIGPVIEKICRYTRPAPPQPKFTVKAMFERSLHLLKLEDKKAQIAHMEAIADQQKAAVVESLGLLVRTAEAVRYGLEMGRLQQMESGELAGPLSLVFKARDIHETSLKTIAYERIQVEDMQRTLDDSALWEQEEAC